MRTRDENKELNIRQKALEMFVKSGFDGFSMQKLAKAAGVSPATIYIYFKDKEDLIQQLYIQALTKMTEASMINFDSAMSFNEGLRVQWMNRARYYMEYPDQMFFLELIRNSPYQDKLLQVMGHGFKNAMGEFVTNAINRNELVKVPLEVFWSIAYAPLYNLVKFHISGTSVGGKKFSFSEEIMDATLNLVIKALKP
ncbi:MAG: regulatory protein TetR [Sphingobacteriales bacterium]|nr:regulatory protein TetR [Sphingobacteriales bacterium]